MVYLCKCHIYVTFAHSLVLLIAKSQQLFTREKKLSKDCLLYVLQVQHIMVYTFLDHSSQDQ